MINNSIVITKTIVDQYRNTGGFDMVGTGRDKIQKPEELKSTLETVAEQNLNGLLIIGGDDSNTNACVVGEYFAQNNSNCNVVGNVFIFIILGALSIIGEFFLTHSFLKEKTMPQK